MITISVDPEGGVTLSQESIQERAAMSQLYGAQEAMEASAQTDRDEQNTLWFHNGWEAAIRECQVNFANGRLPEFFNEIGAGADGEKSEDPHHDEPEGTGETGDDVPAAGWGEPERAGDVVEAMFAANEIGLDVIRPVADSGEPEEEKNQTWDPQNEGTWTMSNEELQSRCDAAYNRGYEQKARQEREAGYQEGFRNGQVVQAMTTKQSLDIIAVETNNRVLQAWDEEHSTDEAIQEPISKGEYARRFAVLLAERLGYEVQA